MANIQRQQNESVERLISRFRRVMMRKGTLKQVRAQLYREKPYTKRQEKLRAMYREKKRAEVERTTV